MSTPTTTSYNQNLLALLSKNSGASSLLAKYNGLSPETKAGVAGMAGNAVGAVIDNATTDTTTDALGVSYQTQSVGGAFASGAAKGAGMGAALGPWGAAAGALLYGGYSAITANKENKEIEGKKKQALDRVNEMAVDTATNNLADAKAQGFNSKGGYSSIYRKGGYIKYPEGGNIIPEYEVEGNEVVQGQDVQLEGQQDLASDMTQAVGPSHENGGVLGVGGERVFSDRLVASPDLISTLSAAKISVGKNATYANIAAKLGKLKGKYEKKLEGNNILGVKTGKAMVGRIDLLTEAVFQDQEFSKQEEDMKKSFAMGGKLPKYFDGVNLEEELNSSNRRVPKNTIQESQIITPKFGVNVTGKFTPPTSLKDKSIKGVPNLYKFDTPYKEEDKPTSTNFANDFFTGDQAINTAVYLANMRNAGKRKTGYNRTVPTPTYLRKNNMLPYMINSIEKSSRDAGVAVDRTSGNVQDVFARKAAITANEMEAKNSAAVQQQANDNAISNQNVQITNNYRAAKAAALNADTEDRIINENAIMANKQTATNAWLQGVMGNLASKRGYDVERAKMAIARSYQGDRGTADRKDAALKEAYKNDPAMLKSLGLLKKGGYIKRKGGYC